MSFDRPDDDRASVAAGRLDQTVGRRRTFEHGPHYRLSLYLAHSRRRRGLRSWRDEGGLLEAGILRRLSQRNGRRRTSPDVIFLVYNDHATTFSLQMIRT